MLDSWCSIWNSEAESKSKKTQDGGNCRPSSTMAQRARVQEDLQARVGQSPSRTRRRGRLGAGRMRVTIIVVACLMVVGLLYTVKQVVWSEGAAMSSPMASEAQPNDFVRSGEHAPADAPVEPPHSEGAAAAAAAAGAGEAGTPAPVPRANHYDVPGVSAGTTAAPGLGGGVATGAATDAPGTGQASVRAPSAGAASASAAGGAGGAGGASASASRPGASNPSGNVGGVGFDFSATDLCPVTAPFFGFMGVVCALVFANLGAAYGTAKSGLGIASMGSTRPELAMRCIIPVIMAGVLGIYGLIVAVIIGGQSESRAAAQSIIITRCCGLLRPPCGNSLPACLADSSLSAGSLAASPPPPLSPSLLPAPPPQSRPPPACLRRAVGRGTHHSRATRTWQRACAWALAASPLALRSASSAMPACARWGGRRSCLWCWC